MKKILFIIMAIAVVALVMNSLAFAEDHDIDIVCAQKNVYKIQTMGGKIFYERCFYTDGISYYFVPNYKKPPTLVVPVRDLRLILDQNRH